MRSEVNKEGKRNAVRNRQCFLFIFQRVYVKKSAKLWAKKGKKSEIKAEKESKNTPKSKNNDGENVGRVIYEVAEKFYGM